MVSAGFLAKTIHTRAMRTQVSEAFIDLNIHISSETPQKQIEWHALKRASLGNWLSMRPWYSSISQNRLYLIFQVPNTLYPNNSWITFHRRLYKSCLDLIICSSLTAPSSGWKRRACTLWSLNSFCFHWYCYRRMVTIDIWCAFRDIKS